MRPVGVRRRGRCGRGRRRRRRRWPAPAPGGRRRHRDGVEQHAPPAPRWPATVAGIGVAPVGVGLRARRGDAEVGDDVGALPRQRLDQVLAGERPAGRAGAEDGHRLGVQLARPDDPVERVLDRAGQRAGVLGRGDQHGVGGGDPLPPPLDRRPGVVVGVGIERRDGRQLGEVVDLDVGLRLEVPAGDVDRRPVGRPRLQAPAHREHPSDGHRRATVQAPAGRPVAQRRC